MEFRQAFHAWKQAHRAAQQAETGLRREHLGPADPRQERQHAHQLRQQATDKLRTMLAVAARAAAACRPDETQDHGP